MEDFKAWLEGRDKSGTTINSYIKTALLFEKWFLQRSGQDVFDATKVTTRDLQDWKEYLITEATYVKGLDAEGNPIEQKYSVTSAQTFFKEIKLYFQYLNAIGVIAQNPAIKIKPPAIENEFEEDPRSLERAEKCRLLHYFRDPVLKEQNLWRFVRNKAIIFSGLYAGFKRSEIVNLQLEDLDFEESKMFVRGGKGGRSRWVPMHPILKKALREWLKLRGYQDHSYVFVSQQQTRLSTQSVWYLCESIGQRLQIEDFTPHVLRHTYAYDLVAKGFDLHVIAEWLGHTNLNFTRVYTRHPSSDQVKGSSS